MPLSARDFRVGDRVILNIPKGWCGEGPHRAVVSEIQGDYVIVTWFPHPISDASYYLDVARLTGPAEALRMVYHGSRFSTLADGTHKSCITHLLDDQAYSLFACLEDVGVVLTPEQHDALCAMVSRMITEERS